MFLSLFSSWSAHNNSIFFKSNLFETTALPHSLAASAQNAFQVKWRVYALDKQINAMDLSEKATIFTIQFIQFATKLCKFVYPFVIEILLWKQRKCTKDKNTQISNEILPSPSCPTTNTAFLQHNFSFVNKILLFAEWKWAKFF